MRRFVVLFTLLFSLVSLLASPCARAEGRTAYVVAVEAGAPELDGARLRAAIGAELQADAVAPDDPRASSARGRIDVSIDRAAGQLVVAYDGGGAPIARRVALPADAASTSLAAVLLAGNLARDEAGELAAQLRRRAPAPQPPSAEEARDARDDALLQRMLSADAAGDRSVRLTTSWTELAVGAAAVAGGAAFGVAGAHDATAVGALGAPLLVLGVIGLASPSRLEALEAYDAATSAGGRPTWLRGTVEQRWRAAADDARRWRQRLLVGIVGVAAVGATTLTLVALADPAAFGHPSSLDVTADVIAGAGAIGLAAMGLTMALTESLTEAGLREYEGAVGRPIQLTDVGLRLAPVPGGFTAGVGGRF